MGLLTDAAQECGHAAARPAAVFRTTAEQPMARPLGWIRLMESSVTGDSGTRQH
jgi:hypothetical protein